MEKLICLEMIELLNKFGFFFFLKQVCLQKSNLRKIGALKLGTLDVRVNAMAN